MKIFALSDPHLSLATPNKSMTVFGSHWVDHADKISRAWKDRVGEEDVVLVAGDVSWAMRLSEAAEDLAFLGDTEGSLLPGVEVGAPEVGEHALGCLGSGIACLSVDGSYLGLEHGEYEGGLLEGGTATGAFDLVFLEEALDGVSAHGFDVLEVSLVFDEVVCPEAVAAFGALG